MYSKLLLIINSLVLLLVGCKTPEPPKPYGERIFLCDADSLTTIKGKAYFVADTFHLQNGKNVSQEASLSGHSSVKLAKDYRYGMTWRTDQMNPGEVYRVSVWKKGKGGKIVVSANTDKVFYRALFNVIKVNKEGWEKIEADVTLPPHLDPGKKVTFYLLNELEEPVYFDDFEVRKLSHFPYPNFGEPNLKIVLSPKSRAKIEEKREAAFREGVLVTGDDPWVKGQIVEGGKATDVKLRLKGDWLDHLQDAKWSFRIKQGSGNARSVYSIHHPRSRNYVYEWVLHQVFRREGLIAPKYEFVSAYIDSVNVGVYAKEEHFTQQMLNSQGWPEGPILKFSEASMWDVIRRKKMGEPKDVNKRIPIVEASPIEVFQESLIYEDPELFEAFKEGRSLMNTYRYSLDTPTEAIFDIDYLAKFWALTDLTYGYHGTIWHNQRMYFNPETKKLYPIAFDHYTDNNEGTYKWFKSNLYAEYMLEREVNYSREMHMHFKQLNDTTFFKAYHHYLAQYSDTIYVEKLMQELAPKIAEQETLLLKEFGGAKYDYNALRERAWIIRGILKHYYPDGNITQKPFKFVPSKWIGDSCFVDSPHVNMGLQAYFSKKDHLNQTVMLHNYFSKDIVVLGGSKKGDNEAFLPIKVAAGNRLPKYQNTAPQRKHQATLSAAATYVYYKIAGQEKVFRTKIRL